VTFGIEFGSVLHASAGAVLHPGNRIRAQPVWQFGQGHGGKPELLSLLF
jgi:hypothetical protein